jgi:hypothetical protein
MPPVPLLQNIPVDRKSCRKDMFLHVARIGEKRGYLKFNVSSDVSPLYPEPLSKENRTRPFAA